MQGANEESNRLLSKALHPGNWVCLFMFACELVSIYVHTSVCECVFVGVSVCACEFVRGVCVLPCVSWVDSDEAGVSSGTGFNSPKTS